MGLGKGRGASFAVAMLTNGRRDLYRRRTKEGASNIFPAHELGGMIYYKDYNRERGKGGKE